MLTLYLVRHGETKENITRFMQGQRPGELTPAGIAQIEALATSLSEMHFDAIISSDLKRAYDSAQILSRKRNLTVQTTPLLRERDWGDWTGRYIPDLQDLPLPDNVEKMEDLLHRAQSFLQWVKNNYPDKTILAVGHGIINKAIQAVHYGKPTREIPKMSNADFVILHLR